MTTQFPTQSRKQVLDELAQRINAHNWDDCTDLCFKSLFGLDGQVQIEVAAVMARRYLAIVEAHFPDMTWPRELLKDPEKWVEKSGRSIPEDPPLAAPSDATFSFAIDGLLLASSNQRDDLVLTSSCVYTVDKSIHALMQNVWTADDPAATAIWRSILAATDSGADVRRALSEFVGRSPDENVAAIAVREREWKRLVEILTSQRIWEYPDPANVAETESALRRWKERESSLMLPLP